MKPTVPPPTNHEPACATVWMPWLAAPLFALLPLGGCGLAGALRPAAAHPPAAEAAGGDAPVVPVLRAADRQVAWGAAAH